MSAAEGVPAWARVLEALAPIAQSERDLAAPTDTLKSRRWERLYDAVTLARAALASDAGTPEGEPSQWPHRYACRSCGFMTDYASSANLHHDDTGHHMRWTGRSATREQIRHDIAGTAPESPAPLAESGAAPPTSAPEISTSLVDAAPDAELDRLIQRIQNAAFRHGEGGHPGNPSDCSMCESRVDDLRAHVAQVTREARAQVVVLCESAAGIIANAGGGDWAHETSDWQVAAHHWRDEYHRLLQSLRAAPAPAPAPGDASGGTLTAHALIAPLIPYLRHDTNCEADDGFACICGKQKAEAEFKRLYRAATGQVVADFWLSCNDNGNTGCWQVHPPKRDEDAIVGVVWRAATDGILRSSVPPMLASLVPPPGKCEYFVVLRRDKEDV